MLDLTWWQVFALVGAGIVSLVGGRMLGGALHRALYRHVLLTRTRADDRFMLRLEGTFAAGGIVLVWQVLVSLMALPLGVLSFCRNLGHIGLLVTLGYGAMRMLDTAVDHLTSRKSWLADPRLGNSILSLARRMLKIAVGCVVAVMVLARMGYAIAPVLVLLGILGGCVALAVRQPVENVLAAYALLGDDGVQAGDKVTLDSGVTGVIEQVGLYSTRLRTLAATQVIIPNKKLADAQIERSFQRPTTRPLTVVNPPRAAND